MLKKSLIITILIDPYILDPLHMVLILEDYNPMNYGKWMQLIVLNFLDLLSYMSVLTQILLLYGTHLFELRLHSTS